MLLLSRMQCSTRLSHVPTPPKYRLSALVSRAEFPEKRPPANIPPNRIQDHGSAIDPGVTMIEGELVDCTNEFIIGNLAVSPIDREVAIQISALIRMPKDPLGNPIRYVRPGAIGSERMSEVMEVHTRGWV